MRYFPTKEQVESMRKDIIDRYGQEIHGDLVSEMSAGRITKIFLSMSKIQDRENDKQIPGQMSLFN